MTMIIVAVIVWTVFPVAVYAVAREANRVCNRRGYASTHDLDQGGHAVLPPIPALDADR
jgi:hypothetical protein